MVPFRSFDLLCDESNILCTLKNNTNQPLLPLKDKRPPPKKKNKNKTKRIKTKKNQTNKQNIVFKSPTLKKKRRKKERKTSNI